MQQEHLPIKKNNLNFFQKWMVNQVRKIIVNNTTRSKWMVEAEYSRFDNTQPSGRFITAWNSSQLFDTLVDPSQYDGQFTSITLTRKK